MHPKTADVIHKLKALASGPSRIVVLEALAEIERLVKELEGKGKAMTDDTQAAREAFYAAQKEFVLSTAEKIAGLQTEISELKAALDKACFIPAVARESFNLMECFTGHPDGNPSNDFIKGWHAALNDAWRKYLTSPMQKPKCKLCWGTKEVTQQRYGIRWKEPCPTCNGTGTGTR